MKKNFLSLIAGIMVLFLNGNVSAGEYSFTTPGLNSMAHSYAYSWGISDSGLRTSFASGEKIISATLILNDIRNWTAEESHFYTSILDFDRNDNSYIDYNTSGIQQYYDGYGSNTGDSAFFSNYFTHTDAMASYKPIQVHELTLYDAAARDITIDLTNNLNKLNEYAATGIFGLGFDPDCHFYANGITINLITGLAPPGGDNTVPEPATLLLFGAGLLGLASRMRKKN